MDRISFLDSLPYLHKVNPSVLAPSAKSQNHQSSSWKTHLQQIHYWQTKHQLSNQCHQFYPSNNSTAAAATDADISSKTRSKTNEDCGNNLDTDSDLTKDDSGILLFPRKKQQSRASTTSTTPSSSIPSSNTNMDVVLSIEPVGYHNHRSNGAAFFLPRAVGGVSDSSTKGNNEKEKSSSDASSKEPKQVDGVSKDSEQQQEHGNDHQKDRSCSDATVGFGAAQHLHDPALCQFEAALLPISPFRKRNRINLDSSNSKFEKNDDDNNNNQHNGLNSQGSVSTSMSMSQSPKKISADGTNNNDEVVFEQEKHILYFWIDNQAYCVDHSQIHSVHVEPSSSTTIATTAAATIQTASGPSQSNQETSHQNTSSSSSSQNKVPYIITKPASLVIAFESCCFRIFQLPSVLSPTTGTKIPSSTKETIQRNAVDTSSELILKFAYSNLENFISAYERDISGDCDTHDSSSSITHSTTHKKNCSSFQDYISHCLEIANRSNNPDSDNSAQNSEDSAAAAHGQILNHSGVSPTVKNILRHRDEESSKRSPDSVERLKKEMEHNVMLVRKAKDLEEQHMIGMKRKRDSYHKSWFALEGIYSQNEDGEIKERRKLDPKFLSDMMTTCAQELSSSYFDDIATMDDYNEEGDQSHSALSKHKCEEILKHKLSTIQRRLDDTVKNIFPAPKAKGRRVNKARRDGVDKNNSCDVESLKERVDACLHDYREAIRNKHSLIALPSRNINE